MSIPYIRPPPFLSSVNAFTPATVADKKTSGNPMRT